MQVRRKMYSLTRSSIQLRRDMERSRLEVMVEDHCSVGYVAMIIVRRIIHYTREVGLIYIVLRRHK